MNESRIGAQNRRLLVAAIQRPQRICLPEPEILAIAKRERAATNARRNKGSLFVIPHRNRSQQDFLWIERRFFEHLPQFRQEIVQIEEIFWFFLHRTKRGLSDTPADYRAPMPLVQWSQRGATFML